MSDWKWSLEPPKESGYYLATWAMGGDRRKRSVSEFWFDGRNWWTGRAYVNENFLEPIYCITDCIIAWTQKPKVYVMGDDDVQIRR